MNPDGGARSSERANPSQGGACSSERANPTPDGGACSSERANPSQGGAHSSERANPNRGNEASLSGRSLPLRGEGEPREERSLEEGNLPQVTGETRVERSPSPDEPWPERSPSPGTGEPETETASPPGTGETLPEEGSPSHQMDEPMKEEGSLPSGSEDALSGCESDVEMGEVPDLSALFASDEDLSSSNEAESIRRRANPVSESSRLSSTQAAPTPSEEERARAARERKLDKDHRRKERKRLAKAESCTSQACGAEAAAEWREVLPRAASKRPRGSDSSTPPEPPRKAPAGTSRDNRPPGAPRPRQSRMPPPQGGVPKAVGKRGPPTAPPRPGCSGEARRTGPNPPPPRPKGPPSKGDPKPKGKGRAPDANKDPAAMPSTSRAASGSGKPGQAPPKAPKADGLMSFAAMARSSLTLEVHPPQGEEGLTEEEILAVQMELISAIADEQPRPATPRGFEGARRTDDGLAIRCVDESSFLWARPILTNLRRGEGGQASRYRVVSPRDRPPFQTFKIWAPVPGHEDQLGRLVSLLEAQNPGLRLAGPHRGLQVRGRSVHASTLGVHFYLEVDERLLPELERLNYRPLLGLSRATIIPRGGGAGGSQEKPNVAEDESPDNA